MCCGLLQNADVLRFLALPARGNVELDLLPLLQGAVPGALDVGKMDENVVSLVTGDEPVTLLRIEKLDSSRSQTLALLPYSNERLLVTAH